MTLDEAISHAEEVAEDMNNRAGFYREPKNSVYNMGHHYTDCVECAEEHRQLAEWLKELKIMRENWQQLKETITEIRDNNKFEDNGATELCRFLLNYMGVLEDADKEGRI